MVEAIAIVAGAGGLIYYYFHKIKAEKGLLLLKLIYENLLTFICNAVCHLLDLFPRAHGPLLALVRHIALFQGRTFCCFQKQLNFLTIW